MCTASALCMGIKGDTWPHSDGGQLALGSGNVACAEAPGHGPRESHASTQAPAAAYAIALLVDLFIGDLLSSVKLQRSAGERRGPDDVGSGRSRVVSSREYSEAQMVCPMMHIRLSTSHRHNSKCVQEIADVLMRPRGKGLCCWVTVAVTSRRRS